MAKSEGPNAVRELLKRSHPGIDVVKRGLCWYITGPGTEQLPTTSLNTYRLDGNPSVWMDAIEALLGV